MILTVDLKVACTIKMLNKINFQHLFEAHQLLLVEPEEHQGTLDLGESWDEAMPKCIRFHEKAFFLELFKSHITGDATIFNTYQ